MFSSPLTSQDQQISAQPFFDSNLPGDFFQLLVHLCPLLFSYLLGHCLADGSHFSLGIFDVFTNSLCVPNGFRVLVYVC